MLNKILIMISITSWTQYTYINFFLYQLDFFFALLVIIHANLKFLEVISFDYKFIWI